MASTASPQQRPATLQELHQARTALSQEFQLLQSSFGSLKEAESRFRMCQQALDEFTKSDDSKDSRELLIPMTGSVFFHGRPHPSSSPTVKVDIGTGVYLEKTFPKAREYYERKIEMLKEQFALIEGKAREKAGMLDMLTKAIKQATPSSGAS